MLWLNIQLRHCKKLLWAVGATAAAISLACVIALAAAPRLPDTATCDEAGSYSLTVKDDKQAQAFLRQFGVTGAISKTGEETVRIPERFNAVYEDYNRLQRRVGLDLHAVSGKTALKTTYRIHSDKADYAVLLLRDGRVVGGHFTSLRYGGKNLPLA